MKIHLSPAAVAVGTYVLHATADGSPVAVCTDHDLAESTELKPDTCYRAIRELIEIGALHDEPRADGIRRLRPIRMSWVWSALVQIEVAR